MNSISPDIMLGSFSWFVLYGGPVASPPGPPLSTVLCLLDRCNFEESAATAGFTGLLERSGDATAGGHLYNGFRYCKVQAVDRKAVYDFVGVNFYVVDRESTRLNSSHVTTS